MSLVRVMTRPSNRVSLERVFSKCTVSFICYTPLFRRCAGFMLSVYGKVRFVVNKDMINTRGRDDLKCAPRSLCAYSAERIFIISRLSRSAERSKRYFHGRGRNGKRHLQRRFLRKRGAADVPAPSSLRDAISPERGRFCSADRQMEKSSPLRGRWHGVSRD